MPHWLADSRTVLIANAKTQVNWLVDPGGHNENHFAVIAGPASGCNDDPAGAAFQTSGEQSAAVSNTESMATIRASTSGLRASKSGDITFSSGCPKTRAPRPECCSILRRFPRWQ
jgi:hypothetical protein